MNTNNIRNNISHNAHAERGRIAQISFKWADAMLAYDCAGDNAHTLFLVRYYRHKAQHCRNQMNKLRNNGGLAPM